MLLYLALLAVAGLAYGCHGCYCFHGGYSCYVVTVLMTATIVSLVMLGMVISLVTIAGIGVVTAVLFGLLRTCLRTLIHLSTQLFTAHSVDAATDKLITTMISASQVFLAQAYFLGLLGLLGFLGLLFKLLGLLGLLESLG